MLQVTEKFRLDLTDEEAARFFQEPINDLTPTLALILSLTCFQEPINEPDPNPSSNPNPNPNPNLQPKPNQELINDSVSALFPQMVETIHRWAQYWRA